MLRISLQRSAQHDRPSMRNYAGLLISSRVNNVEHHGKEKIANQNRQRRVHYCFSGSSTNADCAFACGQPFMATDEHDEYSETERFGQSHDDVTIARPTYHVRHVVSAVNVEHENRHEISGGDADGDALRHE